MKDYIPLKVEFCLYKNILCGSILQQDNRLIEQVNADGVLIGPCNSYRLSILHTPDLYDHVLYLKGKDEDKNNTFCYSYINERAAETALNNFKELIREVNERYYEEEVVEQKNTYYVEVCE